MDEIGLFSIVMYHACYSAAAAQMDDKETRQN